MNERMRIRLLGALLSLWVLVAWGVFGLSDEPQRAPLVNVSGPAADPMGRRGERDSSAQRGLRVNLAQFEATRSQREEGFAPPKNIFASPLAGGGVTAPSMTAGQAMSDAAEIVPRPEPTQHSSPGGSAWRYLGYVVMGTDRPNHFLAVLALEDDLHVAASGARLGDHLIVKAIEPNHVTLLEVPGRIERTLPLVDVIPTE
ncbi:MAG: hypothetical protein NW703_04905 [Nitrospiraceae bacterium]